MRKKITEDNWMFIPPSKYVGTWNGLKVYSNEIIEDGVMYFYNEDNIKVEPIVKSQSHDNK